MYVLLQWNYHTSLQIMMAVIIGIIVVVSICGCCHHWRCHCCVIIVFIIVFAITKIISARALSSPAEDLNQFMYMFAIQTRVVTVSVDVVTPIIAKSLIGTIRHGNFFSLVSLYTTYTIEVILKTAEFYLLVRSSLHGFWLCTNDAPVFFKFSCYRVLYLLYHERSANNGFLGL